MLERDFIMRLIRQFFEALQKLIRDKDTMEPDELQQELDNLYRTYLKNSSQHYYAMTAQEIIDSFGDADRLHRLEMLAELFYQDALCKEADPMLLEKSLTLLKYVDLNSDTFSFNRHRMMGEIEEMIKKH